MASSNEVVEKELFEKSDTPPVPGQDEHITVVVVGPSGCGKSMLITSLAVQSMCETGTGQRGVTQNLERVPVKYKNTSGGCVAVDFIDTPGMTGRARTDDRLATLLKEYSNCNAIACCFDISSRSGRYRGEHYDTLAFLTRVFGEDAMREKAMIVLTKANNLFDEQNDGECSQSVRELCNSWKNEHEKEVKERGDEAKCLIDIPVFVAGSVLFEGAIFVGFSKIDGEEDWYGQLLSAIGKRCDVDIRVNEVRVHQRSSRHPIVARGLAFLTPMIDRLARLLHLRQDRVPHPGSNSTQ